MTRPTLHGFATWVDFIKATLSLGTTIGVVLWAGMLFQLDQRYASADVVGNLADRVDQAATAASTLATDMRDLKRTVLESEIFELRLRECGEAPAVQREIALRIAQLENAYASRYGLVPSVPECGG